MLFHFSLIRQVIRQNLPIKQHHFPRYNYSIMKSCQNYCVYSIVHKFFIHKIWNVVYILRYNIYYINISFWLCNKSIPSLATKIIWYKISSNWMHWKIARWIRLSNIHCVTFKKTCDAFIFVLNYFPQLHLPIIS